MRQGAIPALCHLIGCDCGNKKIRLALLALSVLVGIAAPASAYGEYNRNGDRDVGQSSPP